MAKNKFVGATMVISIDVTGAGTAFNQVTVGRNCQMPPDERGSIDCMGVDEDDPDPRPGIKQSSEFSWEQLWDPDDTQDAAIRTAFDNKTLCNFKVVSTDGTATLTDEWDGYITGLVPLAYDGASPKIMRVTGVRKGAFSEAVT